MTTVEVDPIAMLAPEDLDDLARRVWNLHCQGASNVAIAKQVGHSRPTIARILAQLVDTTTLPSKQEQVAIELHAMNSWQVQLELELRRDGADLPRTVSALVRLSESRRKLLGTDQPEEVIVTHQAVGEARQKLAEWLMEDPDILEADVVDEGEDDA